MRPLGLIWVRRESDRSARGPLGRPPTSDNGAHLDEPVLLLRVFSDVDLVLGVLKARVGGLELLEEDRDLKRGTRVGSAQAGERWGGEQAGSPCDRWAWQQLQRRGRGRPAVSSCDRAKRPAREERRTVEVDGLHRRDVDLGRGGGHGLAETDSCGAAGGEEAMLRRCRWTSSGGEQRVTHREERAAALSMRCWWWLGSSRGGDGGWG